MLSSSHANVQSPFIKYLRDNVKIHIHVHVPILTNVWYLPPGTIGTLAIR